MQSALAKIHEYLDQARKEARLPEKQVDIERTRGLLTGYCLLYENDGFKTVAIEQPLSAPLLDPETREPLRLKGSDKEPTYGGIVDAILEKEGRVFMCDHKTASKVDNAYWANLKLDPQITQYWVAAMQHEWPVDGFLWDVIQKPDIDVKDVTKKAKKEMIDEGTYDGLPFRTTDDYADALEAERETPVMYGMRVMKRAVETPEKIYHRRVIYRTPEDLYLYYVDTVNLRRTMHMIETGELPVYGNRSQCKRYGRACDYASICSGENPERMGFKTSDTKDDERKLPVGCLTPTGAERAMRCWREYFFRDIERIKPIEQEYNTNLSVGSLLHKCMEIFLSEPHRKSDIKLQGVHPEQSA